MSAALSTMIPSATGGLLYYPAEHRGKFPSVAAALASIGCTGEHAEGAIAQVRFNASPAIAVPVNFAAFPGDKLAGEDRGAADDAARQPEAAQ
jgi:hypothetical protein